MRWLSCIHKNFSNLCWYYLCSHIEKAKSAVDKSIKHQNNCFVSDTSNPILSPLSLLHSIFPDTRSFSGKLIKRLFIFRHSSLFQDPVDSLGNS